MVEVSCADRLTLLARIPVAPSPSMVAVTSAAIWFSVLTPEPLAPTAPRAAAGDGCGTRQQRSR